MADRRNIVEGVAVSVFVIWLGWISWEVVGIKSDRNVDDKINAAVLELTKSVGSVSGALNTEIERSKIKDDQTTGWLKFVSDLAQENKGKIITLEVKQDIDHGN